MSILISNGDGVETLETAQEILVEAGGLAGLIAIDSSFIHQSATAHRVAKLRAAVELGRRLARAKISGTNRILDHVAGYLQLRYSGSSQEVMGALFLNVRQGLIAEEELFRGTSTWAAVSSGPILRAALRRNASGLILFHNHPSGVPKPSPEDIGFTKRLARSCDELDIKLFGHVILGQGSWYSMMHRQVL